MSRWSIWAFLVLSFLSGAARAEAPKKVLLLGQGPDGHPAQTHEYMAGLKVLRKCLESAKEIETTLVRADEPWREGPELLGRSDGAVIFLSEGAKWLQQDPKRLDAFQRLARRGGGLVVLHWGMGTRDAKPIDPFLQLFGGCHGGPDRKYQVVETDVEIADPRHPVVAGIANFKLKEEFYYRLKFVKPEGSAKPLLRATIDGKAETVAWTWERPDGGRSFGFSGLHFHDNWRRAEYRRLIGQAVLWSLKLPVPSDGLKVEVSDDDLKLK